MFICDQCLITHYKPLETAMLKQKEAMCEIHNEFTQCFDIHHSQLIFKEVHPVAIAPTDWKTAEIQKFSAAIDPTALKKLADEFKDLKIAGPEDTKGAKAVYDGRQVLKKKRVAIEKAANEIRTRVKNEARAFNDEVTIKEGEYVSILRLQEDRLYDEETKYEAERETIRLEEKKREDDRIQAMINKLNAVEAAVDYATLKGYTQEQFQEVLAEATRAYNEKIELRVQQQEEEEKKKQEALEELKRQQEANRKENERLAAIKAEQDRKAAELKAAQDKLNQEKEELEAAKRKAINEQKARIEKLKSERVQALADLDFTDVPVTIGEMPQVDFEHILSSAKMSYEAKQAQLKKEREEDELRQMEDSERFALIAQQIEIQFLQSPVWTSFKSKSGKIVSLSLKQGLKACKELCESNTKKK
jgi:DNA repair exonuclease SbcCD ATPase subunit